MFNSLKVRIDVDIVHIFNKFDVAARRHSLETVSTQELDTSSSVATPLLCGLAFSLFSADDCFVLKLSYLGTEKNKG